MKNLPKSFTVQNIIKNPSRQKLIDSVLRNKEAVETPIGALATWTAEDSTGRNPISTFIVRHRSSEKNIDWNCAAANAISTNDFERLWEYAVEKIEQRKEIFSLDRVIGADVTSALPVTVITDHALTGVFTDNMFRPVPPNIETSILSEKSFTLISLPFEKIPTDVFLSNGQMCIAMDFERNLGLILGSSYLGSLKKIMFTVANYWLPEYEILPLHCAANEDGQKNSTLILGLSGTGKTTLSTDSARSLIGDDEHSWGNTGIANFENGCYAKLIDLKKEKEPEIYHIAFEEKIAVEENGTIIENAMMYPNGTFDTKDKRLTANSRISYPLSRIKNFKPNGCGEHPKTILFLTADAMGVLPPIAKLDENQAMLWFLMGYTSKLAGTETGITKPKSTFSRFFGEPFMARNPEDYTNLLREKIRNHNTSVYLINTGWSGGAYGEGKRMDINLTRQIVCAALSGKLEHVEYSHDSRFHFDVPTTCPNVEKNILNPKNTWGNKEEFEICADTLASDFAKYFDTHFSTMPQEIWANCPGK